MKIRQFASMLLACLMVLAVLPTANAVSNTEIANTEAISLFGFAERKLNNTNSSQPLTRSIIGFNTENPSVIQAMLEMEGQISNAAEAIGNTVYVYSHDYTYSEEYPTDDTFYRIDSTASTWTTTRLGSVSNDYSVVDLTYAADTDVMYALVFNDIEGAYHIMTVNLSNGQLTDVLNLSEDEIIISPTFTYIGNGQFFAMRRHGGDAIIFDINGNIVREVGHIINDQYDNINAMVYYAAHDCIYGVLFRSIPAGMFGYLITIDINTGAMENHGAIGGGYGYLMTSLFALPNFEISAPSIPSQEEFDAAINAEGSALTFINDTGSPWMIETSGNRTYVRSSTEGMDSSSTSITAVFNGLTAGQILSFDWSVSSESNYDWLSFYVNGTRIDRISGTASWSTYTYTIPSSGDYTIQWIYSKDSSMGSGSDTGSIDNISLTGDQPEPYDPSLIGEQINEALNIEGGTLEFYNDLTNPWIIDTSEAGRMSAKANVSQRNGSQVVYIILEDVHAGDAIRFDWKANCPDVDRLFFRMNSAIQGYIGSVTDWQQFTFVVPQDGDYIFSWHFVKESSDDGPSGTGNEVWVDNVEFIRNYDDTPSPNPNMPDPDDFNQAANAPGESREFENNTVYPWQIVTDEGRNCVVSDIAGIDNVTSEFTVNAGHLNAGTVISFDYKSSCETGWDRLCFTLNGYSVRSYTGENGWTNVTVTIENSGEYVLGWMYEKSHDGADGSDCVWVDNIIIRDETSPELMGDVNGDGTVSARDALMILRYAMGVGTIDDIYLPYADMNGDNDITSYDALIVLRISMGLI